MDFNLRNGNICFILFVVRCTKPIKELDLETEELVEVEDIQDVSFYTEEEKNTFIEKCAARNITCFVTAMEAPSEELLARCTGKIFSSYEETLEFINGTVTIETLKKALKDTDYKITKCSEYQLVGLELPYNVLELHLERQALRDQINALEALE